MFDDTVMPMFQEWVCRPEAYPPKDGIDWLNAIRYSRYKVLSVGQPFPRQQSSRLRMILMFINKDGSDAIAKQIFDKVVFF